MAEPSRTRSFRRAAPLLALALASACAHAPRRDVASSAADLRCEDASFFLAHQPPPSLADQARRVVTAPLSYAATGAGVVAGAATLALGGVLVGALVCSPMIALEAAVKGDGEASAQCIGGVAGPVIATGTLEVGVGIHRATRTWRCLDRSRESRETRAAARCYAARRWLGDLDVARTLLTMLQGSSGIYGCVSDAERRAIDAALAGLTPGAAPAAAVTPVDPAAPAEPPPSADP